MNKRIHAVIACEPQKRHLLTDVANHVVYEFGETVSLLKYSTTGFLFWKKSVLEFKVEENAHFIDHDSVLELIEMIFDRDGDIKVKQYEFYDVDGEEEEEDVEDYFGYEERPPTEKDLPNNEDEDDLTTATKGDSEPS